MVQNASPELLLGGDASLAVVKPLKGATFAVLAYLWGHVKEVAAGDDAAFLGLNHETLMGRLEELRGLGQRGAFLADPRVGVVLPTDETMFRGTALGHSKSASLL